MTNPTQSDVRLPELQHLPAARSAARWRFLPPASERLADPRSAAQKAVEKPIDFPPLQEVVVEGDAVTIAADPNVPGLAEILCGIVAALPLERLGTVTVLLSDEAVDATLEQLKTMLPATVIVKRHDGDEREGLGYLAANQAGDPLYLNRDLTFADFVLPVVLSRPAGAIDPSWEYGGISPSLSDATSRRRFRYELLMRGSRNHAEARQIAWLLGLQMMVTVSPTVDGQPYRIVAGTASGIDRELQPTAVGQPPPAVQEPVDLVLAYLDGDQQQQTWENVGRAVHVARTLVRPGGTIAIVTDLSERPRGSMLRLRDLQTGDEEDTRKRLLKDTDRYALTAMLLLDAQREGRVVLYSHLPAEKVEQLGLGALDSPASLDRLISEHRSSGILRCAQFCGPLQSP